MKNYQYMNLEQKMAKIRKRMPSLLKKFHNDEADYDFATLDDIYESMTPALNKYGVNFDITGEKPTQYDAQGRPVYLTQDPDSFWRYESDLEICWTNIDRPKEKLRVVIHAIGTHEIPDKAHGTAMTYSLKYYFRNKFCMRQIDSAADDPDSMEHPEKDGGNKRKESSASNTGKESSSFNAEKDSRKKSESAACNQQDEKAVGQAAGSKENRIDGNLCRNPKMVGVSLQAEEKAAVEKAPEEKKTGKPTAANSKSGKGTKTPESLNSRLDTESRGETGQKKTAGAPDGPVSEKKQESSMQMESEGLKLVKMQAEKPEDTQKQQVEEKQTGVWQAEELQTEVRQAEEKQTEDTGGAEDTKDGFQTVKEEDVPFQDADFLDELEQEMEEESKETEPGLEEAKNYICPFGVYAGRTLGDMMNSGLKEREVVKWIANHFHGPDTAMVNAAKLLVENADAVAEPQAA